jgi:hypothetical protein
VHRRWRGRRCGRGRGSADECDGHCCRADTFFGFDDTRSWGLVAAVPVGVLTGFAFAMPIAAWIACSVRCANSSLVSCSGSARRIGWCARLITSSRYGPVTQLAVQTFWLLETVNPLVYRRG